MARPHKWGNPFKVGEHGITDAENAVRLYQQGLPGTPLYRELSELSGHDLICWCPLDQPCHADVLLEFANQRFTRYVTMETTRLLVGPGFS